MRVIIYVEGPSDRDGLKALFDSLIKQALQNGRQITFVPMEGKRPLMTKAPLRAVNILRNDRESHVFALPDLYPPNLGYPHSSWSELKHALGEAFQSECRRLKVDSARLMRRFHVHCLKYDFESLLLAAEEQLKRRLALKTFPTQIRWIKPVEDQDHKRPPKRVIEELFHFVKSRYVDTIDAALILEGVNPFDLAEKYSQCFQPFLNDLSKVVGAK